MRPLQCKPQPNKPHPNRPPAQPTLPPRQNPPNGQGRYKIDVRTNAKASFKLRLQCEKLKKTLSANPEAPLNIECLMDDVDVRAHVSRENLEEWAAPGLERLRKCLQEGLAASGARGGGAEGGGDARARACVGCVCVEGWRGRGPAVAAFAKAGGAGRRLRVAAGGAVAAARPGRGERVRPPKPQPPRPKTSP